MLDEEVKMFLTYYSSDCVNKIQPIKWQKRECRWLWVSERAEEKINYNLKLDKQQRQTLFH